MTYETLNDRYQFYFDLAKSEAGGQDSGLLGMTWKFLIPKLPSLLKKQIAFSFFHHSRNIPYFKKILSQSSIKTHLVLKGLGEPGILFPWLLKIMSAD